MHPLICMRQWCDTQVKHLGAGTPVVRTTWDACKARVISRYTTFEKLATKCYPSEASTMASAGQLQEIFKTV